MCAKKQVYDVFFFGKWIGMMSLEREVRLTQLNSVYGCGDGYCEGSPLSIYFIYFRLKVLVSDHSTTLMVLTNSHSFHVRISTATPI